MNNKKDKKEKNPILGIIIAAFFAISAIADSGAGAAGVIIILLVFVGIGFLAVKASKNQKKSSSDGMGECTHETKPTPRSFDGKRLADEAKRFADSKKPDFSKLFTEAQVKKDTDHRADDHEHVEASNRMTSDEKRANQLKSMLKNGIIDKEEYNILMRRYGL